MRRNSGFMKGIGAGMMIGMVAGVAGEMMMKNNKKTLKKKASRAMKTVSNVMEDVSNMMK